MPFKSAFLLPLPLLLLLPLQWTSSQADPTLKTAFSELIKQVVVIRDKMEVLTKEVRILQDEQQQLRNASGQLLQDCNSLLKSYKSLEKEMDRLKEDRDKLQNVQTGVERAVDEIRKDGADLLERQKTVEKQVSQVQQEASTMKDNQEYIAKYLKAFSEKQVQRVAFKADIDRKPFRDVILEPDIPLVFDRVLINVGDGYNDSTGVFTAPYSGLYFFNLQFVGGSHAEGTVLGIYKGRSVLASAYAAGNEADENDQGTCSGVAYVPKGGTVSVNLFYGNSKIWGSRLTAFTGMLVHSD